MVHGPTTKATFEETLRSGKALSHRLADEVIVERRMGTPRIWTGTVVAYPAAEAAFGDSLEFRDSRTGVIYTLDTRRMKGERCAALVLEAGTYALVDERGFKAYVPRIQPSVLAPFPQESGWYDVDAATRLPVRGTSRLRYLWRLEGPAIVAAARESSGTGWAKYDVFLNQRPSERLSLPSLPLDNVVSIRRTKC
ncbi:MAG: hypothetical protein AB1529_07965 [Candidatus Micrarchaeota archaeon]